VKTFICDLDCIVLDLLPPWVDWINFTFGTQLKVEGSAKGVKHAGRMGVLRERCGYSHLDGVLQTHRVLHLGDVLTHLGLVGDAFLAPVLQGPHDKNRRA